MACTVCGIKMPIKGPAQIGKTDRAQAFDQECLGLVQRILQRRVNDLFDRAIRIFLSVSDREKGRTAYRAMNIQQGYIVEVAGQHPTTPMPLFRLNISGLAKARHRSANHGRIGAEHRRQGVGRHRAIRPFHMEQDMQHPGKAAVFAHASSFATPHALASISILVT